MKKKGVSPLIATVLVIAFVIILFGLITTWVRRAAIEPSMAGAEEKVASELECAQLDIKIVKACVNNLATPTSVTLTIDNRGNKDLYKYKMRAIGASGASSSDSIVLNLASLGRTSATAHTISGTGKVTKVEVYPVTTQGTCQGQVISTSTVPVC